MLFRLIFAAATLFGGAMPAVAQTSGAATDVRTQVEAFVQPTNEARTQVVLDLVRAAGFEPEVETFEGGNRRTGPIPGRNVTFVVSGSNPELSDEILLTAHYDAVKLPDGSLSHGVVDNAASVVASIRAAEILRGQRLAHTVRVILFDQEELGLVGAHKWIQAHGLANIRAVVNSDIAGYGDTLMYGQNNGDQSAFVTRAVREMCAERAMPCVGFPIYPPSDDRAFSAVGAPVVSLGFQDQIGAHHLWLAFNGGETTGLAEGFVPQILKVIHSNEDTMDKIDPSTIELAGTVYAELIRKLDTVATPDAR